MSLTILYRDPRRPEKCDMTLIVGQASAAAMVDRLERCGFVVDKITCGYGTRMAIEEFPQLNKRVG